MLFRSIINTIKAKYPMIEDRTDKKLWHIITIDPPKSQDYDDGFSIKDIDEGVQMLSIYISNVTIWMDILNLWDGIRETPGRILVISSNHYDKLDPALVRPGRIDITHELSNASHNTISEIYYHLFNNKIDETKLLEVKENFYSPAELINIYVSNKNEVDFINRLVKNEKCKNQ